MTNIERALARFGALPTVKPANDFASKETEPKGGPL